ncbi:Ldi domain-containing protein [Mycena sanguinolenta]|uniref:Ldi domain-containing protein n=1 Tax=Mycena sanguinolenta TaxID=230812 RepID=A0A8H6XBQ3_9AGAR|nr:Ldi domain-containing protein [Mycena sanguinolenta]
MPSNLPKTLPAALLSNATKLTPLQAGHLRHFHNLATAPHGEWHHMGTQVAGQEWLDSLRYQLATMAYAAGVAHYHRLPALRSVFKALLEGLIAKMLDREVWGYWYLTSQSGVRPDPDIKELRKPWANPVVTENIMYSGHLLLMVSLHAMLFDDDKYDAPDALVFNWNPVYWGMGPERFSYNRTTLQAAILKEMERENWIGVCCEPNSIFVVCNQFPLIAMRYNGFRDGTNLVKGVLEKYTAAWELKKGFMQNDGLFVQMYRPKRDERIPELSVGFTAWACAFMNAWNSEEVHALYSAQALGFLSSVPDEGRVNVNSTAVAQAFRVLVKDGADPNAPTTISKARKMAGPAQKRAFSQPNFGYVAQWVSEVGDDATVEGILRHADTFLNPTWERGGLFYPRYDEPEDADGNWTRMDAYTGNAAIGYARLNVRDGQKKMWEAPWSREHLARSPYVGGVTLDSGMDFLRGVWDADAGAMIVTMRTWDGSRKTISPVFL